MAKINKEKRLLLCKKANMIIKSSSQPIKLNFPATKAYIAVLAELQIRCKLPGTNFKRKYIISYLVFTTFRGSKAFPSIKF